MVFMFEVNTVAGGCDAMVVMLLECDTVMDAMMSPFVPGESQGY